MTSDAEFDLRGKQSKMRTGVPQQQAGGLFDTQGHIELPESMAGWSLTSLQLKLVKIGARVVRHAHAITFQLAEVAVSGALFSRILTAIQRLRAPPVLT